MPSCIVTLCAFRLKTYIRHRTSLRAHLVSPPRLWANKESWKRADAIGMLRGFSITPPRMTGREGRRSLAGAYRRVRAMSITIAPVSVRRGAGIQERRGGNSGGACVLGDVGAYLTFSSSCPSLPLHPCRPLQEKPRTRLGSELPLDPMGRCFQSFTVGHDASGSGPQRPACPSRVGITNEGWGYMHG